MVPCLQAEVSGSNPSKGKGFIVIIALTVQHYKFTLGDVSKN